MTDQMQTTSRIGMLDWFPAPASVIGLLIVFGLPTLAALGGRELPILSNPAIILIGQASYGYYLLHQNAGLALLGLADGLPVSLSILSMLLIQAGLLGVAVCLCRGVEVPLSRNVSYRLRGRTGSFPHARR